MDHFEGTHSITPAAANHTSSTKSCKRKRDAESEETKGPKKKKETSRKTNNSSKSQNKHNNPLPLDGQLENLKHSNASSPNIDFEDFNQENLFVDGWEKDWEDWEGQNCSLANPYDKHNDTSSLDDQFEDLKHSNGSSPYDQFEDFNRGSLFVDGWEKGWEDFLDTDPWTMPYYGSEIVHVNPDFCP